MANSLFTPIPFHEAVARLDIGTISAIGAFDDLTDDGRIVRVYPGDAIIEGDIDLDALLWRENVGGVLVEGDIEVEGRILNWEIDTPACFLHAGGDLKCRDLIAGGADIRIGRNLFAEGAVVATYNHGYLAIGGDVRAKWVIIDDHMTIVRGEVPGYGWMAADAEAPLRQSAWRDEIRPEILAEFFDSGGDFICRDGNVDLVKALLARRDILRAP